MAKEESVPVAYVSYGTFHTALDTLKQGIPPRIDRTVFRGQSGGTQGQLMAAFRALGLIDADNLPQPILTRLVNAETRKPAFREVLEAKYRDLIQLGLSNATDRQLNEKFEEYGVNGATLRKAKAFFLKAASDVGISLSPHITTRSSTGIKSVTTKRVRRAAKREPDAVSGSTALESASKVVHLASGGSITLIVDVPLLDLSSDDRKFVFGLVDALKGYKNQAQADEA